jgi:hypothetical protein
MLPSATLLTLTPNRNSSYHMAGLPMGQAQVFPFPTLAGCSGETRQNKRKSR